MASDTKRGGARPGAGRKNRGRVQTTVMIDGDILDRLAAVCRNRSDFINAAVREKLKRENSDIPAKPTGGF